jgi:hypothetical protein
MKTDWTNPLPNLLGEREPDPRSMRWPKDLAADVEALADAQGQEFTTVALYLLKGAIAEVKASRKTKKAS